MEQTEKKEQRDRNNKKVEIQKVNKTNFSDIIVKKGVIYLGN